jgi:hypothetical protein
MLTRMGRLPDSYRVMPSRTNIQLGNKEPPLTQKQHYVAVLARIQNVIKLSGNQLSARHSKISTIDLKEKSGGF